MNANRLLPPLALAVALAVAAPSAGFIDLNRPTTLGDCWHVCDTSAPEDKGEPLGGNTRTEPAFLQSYCGPAKALPELAAAVLDGNEVVVPVMLGKRDKELRTRTGEVIRVRASLKLLDFDPMRDAVAESKK